MNPQPLNRRRAVSLGGATVISCLLGCSGRGRTSGREKIRISAAPTLSMCSLYLAQEAGYFQRAGLEVELQEIREPRVTLPMLAGGKVDVSFTAFAPVVINALARGGRLSIVAGREIASPHCGDFGAVYGTRKRFPSGIPNFRLLKGKRIAVRRAAGIGEFALETELASVGLPPSAVEMMPYAEAEAMAAVLGGHVDGLVSQGNIERGHAAASQLVRTPGLGQILPNFQYSYVLFGSRMLESSVEMGARFLAAYLRASREFLQGRTPNFMVQFARSNNLDPEAVQRACRGTFVADGTIDFESIQRFVSWAVKRGFCTQTLSRERVVDTRFLELAQRQLHEEDAGPRGAKGMGTPCSCG